MSNEIQEKIQGLLEEIQILQDEQQKLSLGWTRDMSPIRSLQELIKKLTREVEEQKSLLVRELENTQDNPMGYFAEEPNVVIMVPESLAEVVCGPSKDLGIDGVIVNDMIKSSDAALCLEFIRDHLKSARPEVITASLRKRITKSALWDPSIELLKICHENDLLENPMKYAAKSYNITVAHITYLLFVCGLEVTKENIEAARICKNSHFLGIVKIFGYGYEPAKYGYF